MTTGHTAMALTRGPLVLALALPLVHGRGSICHDHEEVRAGQVWIVDCHDRGIDTIDSMALGEFKYEAGSAEWSSRDARMSTVAVDLPTGKRCDGADLERWARCLELPVQFAWCGTDTVARFVHDTSFPRYVDDMDDFVDAVSICVPTNSTVRALPPMRAYNERTVRKAHEAIEAADRAATILIGLVVLCCCVGSNCDKGRYRRVGGGRA